jgi:hypothetical protein
LDSSPNPLLSLQVANNRSSAENWDLYAEHRARVTGLILGLMRATRSAETRLCILGAGNCNDLELGVLSQHCRELHLVDFDAEALRRGLASQLSVTRRENVADVPEGARIALHGGVDLSGIALDLGRGSQNDVHVLAQRALAGPELELGGPFDMAVSTALLTQLISSSVDALGSTHPDLTEVVLAIRNGHLRLMARLLRPGSYGLLLTDVVSSDTLPELVAEEHEPMDGLLESALASGNFFTGANPYALAAAFCRDSILRKTVAEVSMVGPWRWQVGAHRSYLVVALAFRRV